MTKYFLYVLACGVVGYAAAMFLIGLPVSIWEHIASKRVNHEKEQKAIRFVSVAFSLLLFLSYVVFPVFSHQGGTDGAGGHYNHDTGEYHYHHGYPAHQHTNGVCPYAFKDNTGNNSGGITGGGSDFWGDSSEESVSIAIGTVVIAGIISLFLIVQMAKRKAGRSVSSAFDAVSGMSLFLAPAVALVCFILLFASEDTAASLLMLVSCGVVFALSLLSSRKPSVSSQKTLPESSPPVAAHSRSDRSHYAKRMKKVNFSPERLLFPALVALIVLLYIVFGAILRFFY